MVFDLVNKKPFEERYTALKNLSLPDHCHVLEQVCNRRGDYLLVF